MRWVYYSRRRRQLHQLHPPAPSRTLPSSSPHSQVGGEFLSRFYAGPPGARTVLIPTPTWANHRNIFTQCGLTVQQYRWVAGGGKLLGSWVTTIPGAHQTAEAADGH